MNWLTKAWAWIQANKAALKDPIQWHKYADEMKGFWLEVYVENHVQRNRYVQPLQWPRLFVDTLVSFFSMSYTLGHVTAVWLIYRAGHSLYVLFS